MHSDGASDTRRRCGLSLEPRAHWRTLDAAPRGELLYATAVGSERRARPRARARRVVGVGLRRRPVRGSRVRAARGHVGAQRELASNALRDARDDLDDAVSLQPEQALLWRERAAVRATQDDADGAITDLGGALARDPGDALSWSALSAVEERQNQPREAFEAWERVLRLDPMIEDGAGRLKHLHTEVVGAPS